MNAREIIEWVEKQKIDTSNNKAIYSFVSELQGKIMKLDFDLPEGTIPIGYAGSTSFANGTGIYQTVEFITKGSDGKYGFINDVADNILNYEYEDSLGEHSLWSAVENALDEELRDDIFGGKTNKNVRSTQCIDDLLCLNDFVSEQYFKHNGSGNVLFILTDTARNDSTAALTEIELLLRKESVTHINGIPKAELAAMDSKARFEYLKQDSVIALKNARIYYNEKGNGAEIISFEGTRFSDMFNYDIPEGYKDSCRYGTRANLLNDAQLKVKYHLLDGCSEAELDALRGYEYLVANGADAAAISKTGVMSNAELKSAHSFLIGCSDAELDAFRGYEFLVSRNADADVISKTGVMTDSMLKSKYGVLQNCSDSELMDSFRIYDYSLNTKTDSDILHNLGFKSGEEIMLKYNLPDSCSEADINLLGIYDRFMVNDGVSSGSVLPELNASQREFFDNHGYVIFCQNLRRFVWIVVDFWQKMVYNVGVRKYAVYTTQ